VALRVRVQLCTGSMPRPRKKKPGKPKILGDPFRRCLPGERLTPEALFGREVASRRLHPSRQRRLCDLCEPILRTRA